MHASSRETRPAPGPARVLGKAAMRAAEGLGLSRRELSAVLGVSEASLTRISRGDRGLVPQSKEGELAALLVRVFRSLDALVGGDEDARRAWLRADNAHLLQPPAEAVLTIPGLVRVVEYLDALRG